MKDYFGSLGLLLKSRAVQFKRFFVFLVAAGLPILANTGPLPIPLNPADGRISANYTNQSMQIRQKLARETFDWQKFNIERGYRVDFQQPSSSAIALNRIHQNDPSKIFGELNANGQVYLLNSNGFVFGQGSRVNTKTLIATTHNITESVLERGVTQVFNQGEAALVRPVDANGNSVPMGDIVVEKGAKIASGEDGQIILAAPKVVNAGSLESKNGQVIMAASQGKVYLARPDPNSGIQGLVVEVDIGGDAANLGDINVGTGNGTMIGFAVNQKGRVSAKTTVDFGGQIRLLAREGARIQTTTSQSQLLPSSTERSVARDDRLGTRAKVTFGAGSETRIEPDINTGGSAADGQEQPVSSVQVMGHQIEMENGSSIVAPSGDVEMIATQDLSNIKLEPNTLPSKKPPNVNREIQQPVADDTRIILAAGSRIDVSGTTDTLLPMERNVVSVKLTANELRDAPLQKGGFLDRKTIRVDTRVGTPIADISAEVAKINRPLSERTSSGGTVSLLSGGDVIVQQGAAVNIAGGSVTFEDGFIDTSLLVTDDGRVVPVGQADPNLRYVNILGEVEKNYEKWGETLTWVVQGMEGRANFESGYIQGQPAGVLEIIAPRVAFDGELVAGSQSSRRQRELGNIAFGGEFYLNLVGANNGRQSIRLVQHGNSSLAPSLEEFLPDGRDTSQPATLQIDESFLNTSGLSQVSLISNGAVSMDESASIHMLPGSELEIDAGSIEIAGDIAIKSGRLNLKTRIGAEIQEDGSIGILPGARIDLAGDWINDSTLFDVAGIDPIAIDGGSADFFAQGDLNLHSGSLIDVRGGARLTDTLQFIAGRGGDVALEAARPGGSNLRFDGTVLGHAFEQGGRFFLASNEVIVSENRFGQSADNGLFATLIQPEFLEQSGFGTYSLVANARGVEVDRGTVLNLIQRNLAFKADGSQNDASILAQSSGTDLSRFTEIVELPQFERLPVNLTLQFARTAGAGPVDASLKVGQGALIRTDPGASIRLLSDGRLDFDGRIEAPSGTVDLVITPPGGGATPDRFTLTAFTEPGFLPDQILWLGSNSGIIAQGILQAIPDPSGRTGGTVLPGGTVTVDAQRGFVVFENGALIDVSGASGELDLPVLNDGLLPGFASIPVASDAGAVNFLSAEGAFLDGNLLAMADANLGAAGGRLNVEIDPTRRGIDNAAIEDARRHFPTVTSELWIYPDGDLHLPSNVVRGTAIPEAFYGRVQVNSQKLTSQGLESLRLFAQDRVGFVGSTSLALQDRLIINTPRIQAAAAGGSRLDLSASYLQLGSTLLNGKTKIAPTTGTSHFQANANLIDLVGVSSLEGFSQAHLQSSGDIRLRGNLIQPRDADIPDFVYAGNFAMNGDLTLQAGQIYPTTLTEFVIDVQGGASTTLTVLPGGQSPPVLSAAGKLNLIAPNIVHAGVLKAPFGSIELDAGNNLILAAGSKTSVSAENQLIPFGRVQGGLNWAYPLPGNLFAIFDSDSATSFSEPPQKAIRLDGTDIDFRAGAEINADGGGDLYAFEVVRDGPGGSRDELDPVDPDVVSGLVTYQEKFAVLPGLQGQFAPYDPLEFPVSGLNIGDSVFLHGTAGLAAGNYVLLPAHYALLPGAMLVTPVAGTQDLIPGLELTRLDGAPITAGYRFREGTDNRESRLSGFAVEPGILARTRSDFLNYTANGFFSRQAIDNNSEAPRLPVDAGVVSVNAASTMNLGGQLLARPGTNGRGGELDIQARNLAVVASLGGSSSDVVEISAAQLNQLDVASLLLGGSRKQTRLSELFPDQESLDGRFIGGFVLESGTANELDAGADSVTVANGVTLNFAETILLAEESIRIESGSSISSRGKTSRVRQSAAVRGDAAIVRVNNQDTSSFARVDPSANPARGSVQIESGSILDGGNQGSILVDAPVSLGYDGEVRLDGGSLALSTSAIDLGGASANTDALVIDNKLLAGQDISALYLNSLTRMKLLGNFALGSATTDVELSAPGFSGLGQDSEVFGISADRFRLRNRSGNSFVAPESGTGTLNVDANTFELASGEYSVDGFNRVTVSAPGGVIGVGNSQIRLDSDLSLITPYWATATGSNTQIDASGRRFEVVKMTDSGTLPRSTQPGLGSKISVQADEIDVASAFILPSGAIDLQALNGDLNLLAGSLLDVRGDFVEIGRAFATSYGIAAPTGSVALSADLGDVRFDSGAVMDLSGVLAERSSAGELSVTAPQGEFMFDGQIFVSEGIGLDLFSLDVNSMEQTGFNTLLERLATIPVRRVDIGQRSGDLAIDSAEALSASDIRLQASTGSIDVAGALDASEPQNGGRIRLVAGDEIILRETANLAATGVDGSGGRVELDAWDRDQDGLAGVTVEAGAWVDLSGSEGGGEYIVRAPRVDRNNDGQDDGIGINGALAATSAEKTTVEGTRVYDDNLIDAADVAGWRSDATLFMDEVQGTLGNGVEIIPGILVTSEGDLTLDTELNLLPVFDSAEWRYNQLAGTLSLFAEGDILINQSISDGFASRVIAPGGRAGAATRVDNALHSGQSWSYRFNAGRSLKLAADKVIRTGTGDIEVVAGSNLEYGSNASSIYSAGRQTTQTLALDPNDPTRDINGDPIVSADIANNPYGTLNESFVANAFYAEYPVDGGDVSLTVGGDIIGRRSDQFVTDWLVRMGNWNPEGGISSNDLPTAWGIAIDRPASTNMPAPGFRQSVGAFGGGSVEIVAGGSIEDLSVVLPTSGKQVSPLGPNSRFTRGILDFTDNQVVINESGDLYVSAGGNIVGGLYYVGSGSGSIYSGGEIAAGSDNIGLLLAMNNARFSVNARSNIAVSGVFDSNAMAQTQNDIRFSSQTPSLFFSFGPETETAITSVAGDTLWRTSNLTDRYRGFNPSALEVQIVPPRFRLAAGRDLRIESNLRQFPSPVGQLELVAGRDIAVADTLTILQSDTDPAGLPDILRPVRSDAELERKFTPTNILGHAPRPVHSADFERSVIIAGRDIVKQSGAGSDFWLAEATLVQAGRDLLDSSFIIQNNRPGDISLVQAGRDIRYRIPFNEDSGAVRNVNFEMQAQGPGKFYVMTGRDLDLGAASGITSTGNFFNPNLADGGADITILAGMDILPDVSEFSRTYLDESTLYDDRLIQYTGVATGAGDALSRFNQLNNEERLALILEVFYNELREGGRQGAASQDRSDYARGDAAIAALFDENIAYDGDVRVFFSRIHTVDGGDINMLIPGGELNAGLAVAFNIDKGPDRLGVVAQQTGNINIFVRDDLQVNSSRVATFGGGDILGWSSLANIDAGRGAKASVTIPPPTIVFDENDQPVKVFSPAIAVSGIQAATTRDGDQGNVDLFAPEGVIDAGLAGIAGADVTVGAVAVLNADNISFSGSSVGVPLGTSTSIAVGLTGASNLATSTSKLANSTSRGLGGSKNQSAAAAGFLKVEFLGFGI